MDKLSPEVFGIILDYVFSNDERCYRYAAVSRYWQCAVESKTMRSVVLKDQDLDGLTAIFLAARFPHRRHVCRDIYLETHLPHVGLTPEDRGRNNEYFQKVLTKLFVELASWGATPGAGEGCLPREESLSLTLRWSTPFVPSTMSEEVRWPPVDTFLNASRDENRLELPLIRFVTDLHTVASKGITPHPSVLCYIVSRLPSIESLKLEMWEPSLQSTELRIEHRRALATGVANFLKDNPSLASLEMQNANFQKVYNDSFDGPDFTENGIDPLSTAIRTLGEAGKLTRLDMVSIPISSDLFCNPNASFSTSGKGNESVSGSIWPSIQYIRVRGEMMTADGCWLYNGDPDAPYTSGHSSDEEETDEESDDMSDNADEMGGDDEDISMVSATDPALYNVWRLKPDTTVFDPMIHNIVRTATRGMPALRQFCFDTQPAAVFEATIALQMAGPESRFIWGLDHEQPPETKDDESLRRFKFWVGPDWEVPEGVLAMGREWTGDAGVVRTARL